MSKIKIHFVIDKTYRAQAAKKILLKKYDNYSPKRANVIVVIGGDGFMLETLKKYQKFNKAFYGMNRGAFGFLMNKFKTKNILNSISKAKNVDMKPRQSFGNVESSGVKVRVLGNDSNDFKFKIKNKR